jgi:DNA-binding NarL/FixJ family response regulator
MRRRILVIDDNAAFRGALGKVLDTDRFTVIAEAATGASGVQLARQHEPDLVIVDVQLPDTDGFDVAEQLAALDLPMEVILTSGLHLSDLGTLVAESSARGFIPKAELSVRAIDALLGEGAATSPSPKGDSGFGDNT